MFARGTSSLFLSACLAACGSEGDAPPVAEPEPATLASEVTEGEAEEEAEATADPTPANETATMSIPQLVRQARAHFREHEYAQAAHLFESALARNPGDGGLACETGWAMHHAGDDTKARRLLTHGTRVLAARQDRRRSYGACLYNLGRMAEDAGRGETAAHFYTTSLRARPNRIVRGRLDALEVELESERPLYGTLEDAANASEGFDSGDDEENYIQDFQSTRVELPSRLPLIEVATLSFTDGGAWRCYYHRLTARLEGGWLDPIEIGDACSPIEEGGVYGEGSFEVEEFEWITSSDLPTLALRTAKRSLDCAYEDDEGHEASCSDTSGTKLVVYRYQAGALEPLFELPLASAETEDEMEQPGAYEAEYEIGEDGRITVRATRGAPPRWTLGTHTVNELAMAFEREAASHH